METAPYPRLLRASEVAAMLGISAKRVRELSESGALESVRLGKQGWHRFRAEDVERLIAGEEKEAMKSEKPAATGSSLSNRTNSSVHLRPVEPGELHPLDRCAWCGSSTSELYRTIALWTEAPAMFCLDSSGCTPSRDCGEGCLMEVSESYFEQGRHPSDVSGKARMFGNACGLDEVVAAFDELLLLPDHGAVYVALAGIVANYAEGDVVWPLLVGPSGCGKSELITAITSAPGVWPLSSLTPQTLISGFERKGEPASLLLQIGKFGILAFKDLTTVLTMHREARAQIIGQLREVADGKTEKSFGNGLRLEWEGKLGFIAGVTPIIDEQHSFISVMGERFLLYRLPAVPRAEIARRSLARRGREPELRTRIRATVGDFLEQFVDCGVLELPTNLTENLIVLSDMVTRARSGVPRDFNGNLSFIPEPEAATRLAKQLAQLGAALIAIGVDEAETWRLVRKAGWDSVPAVRCAVLDCLAHQPDAVPMATIQEETGLPERTAARVVEDVVVLGLAKRAKESGKWLIEQSELTRLYWKDERLPETSEVGHGQRLPETSEGASPVVPGDDMFPVMIANAVKNGHITEEEAWERYGVHRLVEDSR